MMRCEPKALIGFGFFILCEKRGREMIELNLNNLTKFYGANKIFQNISFDVKTGERIGLIGQNGCGKTTIMKILMGIEEHQGGEISLRKDNKVGILKSNPSLRRGYHYNGCNPNGV